MTHSPEPHQVTVDDDGRVTAAAEVSPPDEQGVARSAMHLESGQLPPGTRARLVDAVVDDPAVAEASHLVATVPSGDTGLLDRLRERADSVEVRATGATKFVDAELPPRSDR
jgi:hypothetical protein